MESTQATMRLWLGSYRVIQAKLTGEITIDLGRNITITVHPGDTPHTVKEGMYLPLYTEIPYAQSQSTPVQ